MLGLKVTKSCCVSALFLKLIFMEKFFVPSPFLMLCQIFSPLNCLILFHDNKVHLITFVVFLLYWYKYKLILHVRQSTPLCTWIFRKMPVHASPVLCPFVLCRFAETPLTTLRHFLNYALSFFGLGVFGRLHSFMLTPYFWWEYHFLFMPTF